MKMSANTKTTTDALLERLHGKTYRALARELDYPDSAIGMFSDVAHGHQEKVSKRNLRELRYRLRLAKRPAQRRRYLRPCLSLDPRRRLEQLAALVAQAEREAAGDS